jgi:uncharacterized protein
MGSEAVSFCGRARPVRGTISASMPASRLDYGQLVERALRRVVRDALEVVAEQGLPGRHHFYITFRTDHPDVVIDDGLHARYPTEMTIVLQHEFWGLEVLPERFGVTLSFGGAPQRLEIPYDAVRVFADPSVEFGLQFTVAPGEGEAGAMAPAQESGPRPAASVAELPTAGGGSAEAPSEPDATDSAEVVTLDRFRKK